MPLGVFSDGVMVGFVMYCIYPDDGEYWIYRMMTGRPYQSRGFGTKALKLLVERIKRDKSHHCIMLGVHVEDEWAVALYERFGFKPGSPKSRETFWGGFTGQVFGREHIMKYEY